MSWKGGLLDAGISSNGNDVEVFRGNLLAANIPGTNGNVYYVDSVNGSSGNSGRVPAEALATVGQGIASCTANQGDIVYLLPKHAQTIADATTFITSIDGISIIGLGKGGDRATFTFTAAASSIKLSAATVHLENILLVANYTGGVTAGITIGATAHDNTLVDVEMRETANTKEWLIGISITAGCDRTHIYGFRYFGIAGGSTTQVIKFAGASDYFIIRDFLIYVDASGAAIDALTAASLFVTIGNGVVHQLDTGAGKSIEVKSDTTGFFHDLRVSQLKGGVYVAGAAMAISEVYISNVIFNQGFYAIVQDS